MSAPRARNALGRAVIATVVEIWHRLAQTPVSRVHKRSSQVESLEGRVLMARVEGIDVSQFQGNIDWPLVRAAGKEFAFQRATIGGSADASNLDTKLSANMLAGASAGVLMGVYHHAKPDSSTNDAANEATWFLSNAEQYVGPGWLRPVIDVETSGGLSVSALSQWVNDFSDAVETATGVEPIIYSNTSNATNSLGTAVNDHALWVARYNTGTVNPQTDQPQTPSGFNNPYGVWNVPVGSTTPSHASWSFWQYSNTGSVNGISGNVDLDIFQGDRATLESNFLTPASGEFKGVAVNFGPYEHAVPSGYINFGNQTFGDLFGYQMGWNATGVVTNTQTTGPDARYKSYALPRVNGVDYTFELAVPNGDYRVRLIAGGVAGNTQKLWAEGVGVVDAVTNTGNEFRSGTAIVDVSDGRLTINSSSAGPNTRLVFLDVVPAGRLGSVPAAPSGVTTTAASSTAIDVRWTDNADNEGRDPSTFDSSTWAQVNEGYKIERRTFSGGSWSGWSTIAHARANAESFQDTGLSSSIQYQYRVSTVNAAGSSAAVEGSAVTPASGSGQQAYTSDGTPWPLGATIQAEDFDRGGEGVSFHDLSTDGNAGGFYRDAGMDLGRIGSVGSAGAPLSPRQHRIGWFRPGEWVEYTVDVPAAGEYVMQFRVSVPGSGAKFHATTTPVGGGAETNLAGPNANDKWDVPNTGDWNAFTIVDKPVTLPAGQQVIRVYADTKVSTNPGVMDFDWLRITGAVPHSLTASALDSDAVQLEWSSPGNATYNVYRATTAGFTPSTTNRIASAVASNVYTDRTLAPATNYYYKVRGRLANGAETAATNEATAQTLASVIDLVVGGISEAQETTGGIFISTNDDFDEGNHDATSTPIGDNEADATAGHRLLSNDDELRAATLTIDASGANNTWSLSYQDSPGTIGPPAVKMWRFDAATSQYVHAPSGQQVPVSAGVTTINLLIEGMVVSRQDRDVAVTATLTSGGATAQSDTARLTVVKADLDVDSDNDNGFGLPENNQEEFRLEDNPAMPGKYVTVNSDSSDNDGVPDYGDGFNQDGVPGNADDSTASEKFVPMLLFMHRPIDVQNGLVRFSYSGSDPAAGSGSGSSYSPAAGHLRIWTVDGSQTRNKAGVAAGGNYVAPMSPVAPAALGFSGSARKVVLFVEAIAADPSGQRVLIDLDPDGASGPEGFVTYDALRLTPLAPAVGVPAPTNLTAVPAAVSGGIDLDWNDLPQGGISGYRIYRSATAGFTPSAGNLVTAVPASRYSDTGLASATTFYYRVTAVDASGAESPPSNEATATTANAGGPGVLARPTNLVATALSSTQINVTWVDNSGTSEDGFLLERSIDAAFPDDPAQTVTITVDRDDNSHDDGGLLASTTYYYRVRAFSSAAGTSAYSNSDGATTGPATPTDDFELNGGPASGESIAFNWSAVPSAARYRIEISTDGVDFFGESLIQPGLTDFAFGGFDPGDSFVFRAAAVSAAGNDIAYSNLLPVTMPAAVTQSLSAPGPQQPAAVGLPPQMVVGFNGYFLNDPIESEGNKWFERIIRDTGLSTRPPTGPDDLIAYEFNGRQRALGDVYLKVDANDDLTISAQEAADARVIVMGYSLGGVEAANFTVLLNQTGNIQTPTSQGFSALFTVQAPVQVDLLVTLDPVTGGIAPLLHQARLPKGRLPANVGKFVNYYQTRAGTTDFDLYLLGSSNNGQTFSAFSRVGNREVGTPISALINGVRLRHNLPAAKVKELNLSDNAQVPAGRYAADVNYWIGAPLAGLDVPNHFDADLTASGVEHLALPWYVSGYGDPDNDPLVNVVKDIASV